MYRTFHFPRKPAGRNNFSFTNGFEDRSFHSFELPSSMADKDLVETGSGGSEARWERKNCNSCRVLAALAKRAHSVTLKLPVDYVHSRIPCARPWPNDEKG